MFKVQIEKHGGPEVLQIRQAPIPMPAAGEVRVRHEAIGVNFIDTYHRSGLYTLPLPSDLGMEAAGVVEALGDDVHSLNVGARVTYAAGPPGAYAQLRCIRADRCVPLPAAIDSRTAAAAMLKGMTVEFLIHRAYQVKRGDWVLLHAAAGGVGLIACQWLKHLGARVIGTVGSEEKAKLAQAHGCEFPIVYRQEKWPERVRELTQGAGVAVVYDSVGKDTLIDSLKCLEPRGMLVNFGNASGKPEPLDLALLAQNHSLFVTRPTLFDYTASREDLLLSANRLFDVLSTGVVKVHIDKTWPLTEVANVHRALESRTTTGSQLLLP